MAGEAAIICEPFWRVGHELVFLLMVPHPSWLLQAEEPVKTDGQIANLNTQSTVMGMLKLRRSI